MKYAERLDSGAAGYMLPLRDKCREKIQGTEETEMKRRIVLALCVAVGIGLTHDAGGEGAFRG